MVALLLPIVFLGLVPTVITDLIGAGVMAMNIPFDWVAAGPATIVFTGAVLGLMVDAFAPRRTWLGSGVPTLAGVLAGGAELLRTGSIDDIAFGFSLIVVVGTALVVVASIVMNAENAMPAGEFHLLLGSAASGGLVMASARDLVTLVVAIELLALPSIALVGLRQGDRRAIASSWTFFLTSVVSTAVTLMGIALLYGSTGTLSYAGLSRELEAPSVPGAVVSVGVVLTIVGLLFKLGAVPFHVWVPDTYRGASVMVAGFLASVSKSAALGALLVLLALGLGPADDSWQPVIAVVAAVSMTIGNLGALRQRDGVAMLAWSSVAQAGFLIAPAAAIFTASGLSAPAAVPRGLRARQHRRVRRPRRRAPDPRQHRLRRARRPRPHRPVARRPARLRRADARRVPARGRGAGHQVRRAASGGRRRTSTWLAVVMAINVMLGLAYYLRLVAVVVAARRRGSRSSPGRRRTRCAWRPRVAVSARSASSR